MIEVTIEALYGLNTLELDKAKKKYCIEHHGTLQNTLYLSCG